MNVVLLTVAIALIAVTVKLIRLDRKRDCAEHDRLNKRIDQLDAVAARASRRAAENAALLDSTLDALRDLHQTASDDPTVQTVDVLASLRTLADGLECPKPATTPSGK